MMRIVGGFFMNYHAYILYSQSKDRYYIGSTANLVDRLQRHNQGRSKATKAGHPWQLVFKKTFQDRSSAYRFEMGIKKQKSRKYIEQLVSSAENEQPSVG